MPKQSMRAVVITRAGGPEVLSVREVSRPSPAAGELLVRVQATALNRADILQRQGRYPAPADSPQDIPGLEFAGEIAGLGSGVTRRGVGQRVFGLVGGGAHAEFVVTNERAVVEIPDRLSWADAAAVPEAFITAHDALVTQAAMGAGESVLIHAVASGVGLAAVQLARAWNARPFGTTRTPGKLDAARAVGLIDGLALGTDLRPLADAVARWTDGIGVDVVLDLIGGPYLAASIRAAAMRGRVMMVGSLGGSVDDFPIGPVLGKRLRLTGTVLRSRGLAEKIDATDRFDREVIPLLASGAVRPVVDSVWGLDGIADAHRRMESDTSVGKIVLTL